MGLDISKDALKEAERKIEPLSQEKLDEYLELESEWIDDMFKLYWPKVFSWFTAMLNRKMSRGEKPGFLWRIAIFIMARLSGFSVNRNQHLKMQGGNGFRAGSEKIVVDKITVTLLKHGKEVVKRDFKLSVY